VCLGFLRKSQHTLSGQTYSLAVRHAVLARTHVKGQQAPHVCTNLSRQMWWRQCCNKLLTSWPSEVGEGVGAVTTLAGAAAGAATV
jgi:hypothetical protein